VKAASAALPMPVGSAVTATLPAAAGSADGNGSGSAGSGAGGTGTGSGPAAPGATGGGAASGPSRAELMLPASAGQGEPGPLPAGALPADGAVPGASQALRALAAARESITALPHSPQLLSEMAGPGGWTPNAEPAVPTSPASIGTGSASAGGTGDPQTPAPTTPAPTTPAPATSAAPTPTAQTTPTTPTTPTAQSAARSLAGLDVAGYQHPVTGQYPNGVPIDWPQVAAEGYRFASVKGTEGDYYVNPWAATDLADAKAAGLDVDPYHFAIPNVSSGPEQAEFAVEYSGYAPGAQMMPLMLDIEYDPYVSSDGTNECYGLSASQMTAWISGFITTAQSLTGQYPIIYTTANWWDTCTGGSTAFSADPMWVAAYGFASPPLPAGWSSWSFWQYTSGGTVPGVDSQGTTDLDSFSPTAIGLIDPGALASRPLTRVSVPLGSLGSLAGEKLTWTAAGLPPGVRVTAGGVLAGMITSTRSALGPLMYRATVTARNAAGASATVSFGWQIATSCPNYLTFGVCPGI
jgi:GH25 family lysozyme M1 (1,4-beta-N-acetylmuramidase)